eukprot:PLAT163.2.p1 GENE.PLAT163.2~~PLAT163.2.p1  ORF type:complete len:697 (+),score=376.16 PLAT163.2:19-2109(+)
MTPNERLWWAAGRDDVDAMEAALADGADLNWTHDGQESAFMGTTALQFAALSGAERTLAALMAKEGINLDSRSASRGFTAVMWAAYVGQPRCVALLLAAGADGALTCPAGRDGFFREDDSAMALAVRLLQRSGRDEVEQSQRGMLCLAQLLEAGVTLDRTAHEVKSLLLYEAAKASLWTAAERAVDELGARYDYGSEERKTELLALAAAAGRRVRPLSELPLDVRHVSPVTGIRTWLAAEQKRMVSYVPTLLNAGFTDMQHVLEVELTSSLLQRIGVLKTAPRERLRRAHAALRKRGLLFDANSVAACEETEEDAADRAAAKDVCLQLATLRAAPQPLPRVVFTGVSKRGAAEAAAEESAEAAAGEKTTTTTTTTLSTASAVLLVRACEHDPSAVVIDEDGDIEDESAGDGQLLPIVIARDAGDGDKAVPAFAVVAGQSLTLKLTVCGQQELVTPRFMEVAATLCGTAPEATVDDDGISRARSFTVASTPVMAYRTHAAMRLTVPEQGGGMLFRGEVRMRQQLFIEDCHSSVQFHVYALPSTSSLAALDADDDDDDDDAAAAGKEAEGGDDDTDKPATLPVTKATADAFNGIWSSDELPTWVAESEDMQALHTIPLALSPAMPEVRMEDGRPELPPRVAIPSASKEEEDDGKKEDEEEKKEEEKAVAKAAAGDGAADEVKDDAKAAAVEEEAKSTD